MKSSLHLGAFAFALFVSFSSQSEPIVTAVTPSHFQHGRSGVIISGSNFGTKDPAAPYIFDDLEDGFDPRWGNFYEGNKYTIVTDQNRDSHGTRTLRADFSDDTFHHFSCRESDAHDGKWYVHYWFKYADNFNWDDSDNFYNIKFWRLFPTNWSNDHFVNVFINWRPDGGFAYTITEGAGTPDYYFKFNPKNLITLGVWHSIEVEYAPNSALDAEDGVIRFWFDGALKEEMTTAITSTTAHPNRQKYPFLAAGMHCAWGPASTTTYFWMDDVYVDRAWSRVVIADKPTWEQCAHKEVQIPSAWSDGSIAFTVQQGSFPDGTAYLYVIDADGNKNQTGFPITLGDAQTPDTTPPSTSGHLPAKSAAGVPITTSVSLHVTDAASGVDQSSINMTVNGSQADLAITGTPADFTVTYDPPQDFDYNQTVTITIDASDIAGNAMPPDTYTFTTEPQQNPLLPDDPAATDPNVFFFDDFEQGDFSHWDATSNISTSTGQAQIADGAIPGSTGKKIAQFTTFNASGSRALVDLRKNFHPGYDTVYARWYAKFASDFNQGDLMHFCGLIAGSSNWRSDFKPDGTDAFSSFLDPWRDWGRNPPPGKLMFYTYYPDMKQDPDGHWWGNMFPEVPEFQIDRDRWYCMEMMIKSNTPGQLNGEQAFWIDGQEAGHWYGMRWRDVDTLKIDFFWLELYIHYSSQNNTVWFDNVALSTHYIGPIQPQPDTSPPSTSGHSPAKGATGVSVSTDISLHVTDDGDGVDISSISMTVNGLQVSPAISGAPADYLLVYDPPSDFAPGETVTVTLDAQDLHSPPNPMPQDTYSFSTAPQTDLTAPVITNTSVSDIGHSTATVTWNTDEPATSRVDYGLDTTYGQTAQTADLATDHAITLNSLQPDTLYHFRVASTDASGNQRLSADYSLTTQPLPPGTFTEIWGDVAGSDHPGTIRDTFININSKNYASDPTNLNTYTWPANTIANAILIKFDLSAIPSNATIASAKLYLYLFEASSEPTYDISVHKIVNVNPVISAATGYSYDGINPWTPFQGLYDNIPLGQSDIAPPEDTTPVDTAPGYKQWTVTNMVSEWISNPDSNRGLMLNSDPTAASDAYRFFRPSEYTDPAQLPRLVITYTISSTAPPGPPGKPMHVD